MILAQIDNETLEALRQLLVSQEARFDILIGLVILAVVVFGGAVAVIAARAGASRQQVENASQNAVNRQLELRAGEVASLRTEHTKLQGRLDEQRDQLERIRLESLRAADEAAAAKEDREQVRADLEATQRELASIAQRLAEAQKANDQKDKRIEELMEVVGEQNIRVTNLLRDLETERKNAQQYKKERDELKRRVDDLESQMVEVQQQVKKHDTGELHPVPEATPSP